MSHRNKSAVLCAAIVIALSSSGCILLIPNHHNWLYFLPQILRSYWSTIRRRFGSFWLTRMLVKRMLIAFGAINIPGKKESNESRICSSTRTSTLRDDQSSYMAWRKCQGFMSHQSRIARSWSVLYPRAVPFPFTRLSIFWLA
jgi:hypothetical protein